jgi:WhiB family redox-sensing transcriptional regulator
MQQPTQVVLPTPKELPPMVWRSEGACRGKSPQWWYPSQGGATHAAKALRICAACPVKMECLDWSIEAGEWHGIWGGMLETERRREGRRRERMKANGVR